MRPRVIALIESVQQAVACFYMKMKVRRKSQLVHLSHLECGHQESEPGDYHRVGVQVDACDAVQRLLQSHFDVI
ncbi:hypothetical protein NCR_01154 [Burkholderia pseudomallei]